MDVRRSRSEAPTRRPYRINRRSTSTTSAGNGEDGISIGQVRPL
jgi:hypothetical protein